MPEPTGPPCHHCGTTIAQPKQGKRFCSRGCKEGARKRRSTPSQSPRRSHNATCEWCDTSFSYASRTGAGPRYCSDGCRWAAATRQTIDHSIRAGRSPGLDLRVGFIPTQLSRHDIGAYNNALCHDPCAYCGTEGGVIDHVDPKINGGPDQWDNYTAACASCNQSKMRTPLLRHMLRGRIKGEVAGAVRKYHALADRAPSSSVGEELKRLRPTLARIQTITRRDGGGQDRTGGKRPPDMSGDDDQVVPFDVGGRASAALVDGAELKVYPGAPHGITDTHKQQLADDLLAFARGGSVGGPPV